MSATRCSPRSVVSGDIWLIPIFVAGFAGEVVSNQSINQSHQIYIAPYVASESEAQMRVRSSKMQVSSFDRNIFRIYKVPSGFTYRNLHCGFLAIARLLLVFKCKYYTVSYRIVHTVDATQLDSRVGVGDVY